MGLKDSNIFWIGGSFSGGKSTTARALSDRFGLPLYRYDWHLLNDPVFADLRVRDRRWFWLSNDEKLARYKNSFPLALDQIQQMAANGPMLVEGPGLIPELISSIDVSPTKVIFLLPTPDFQRKVNPQRGAWVDEALATHDNRKIAWEEWMELDDQFANYIESSADKHGFTSIRTGLSTTKEAVASLIASHFGFMD